MGEVDLGLLPLLLKFWQPFMRLGLLQWQHRLRAGAQCLKEVEDLAAIRALHWILFRDPCRDEGVIKWMMIVILVPVVLGGNSTRRVRKYQDTEIAPCNASRPNQDCFEGRVPPFL